MSLKKAPIEQCEVVWVASNVNDDYNLANQKALGHFGYKTTPATTMDEYKAFLNDINLKTTKNIFIITGG